MLTPLCMILFLTLLKLGACEVETIIVNLSQGQLRGKVATTFRGLDYYSFQGVPYAKPPVGEFRFKPPQPAESWEGIKDALKEGSLCPQSGVNATEDCLFINVYTTYLPEDSSETLRPVLVWIHGGGLIAGSGNIEQQGPDYLLEEEIVVVTLNYRLGALGFISLQGTEISSNNGLKDQSLALHWIQSNIAHFGGNPTRVTIWGESAGAASVHGQMLSPMSKGLFHQVISESGTLCGIPGSWSFYAPGAARSNAFKLGQVLSVTTDDTSLLIQALRNATAEQIVQLTSDYELQFTVDIESDVSPDEAFLPASPLEIITQGKYNDVPLLIGTNSEEGLLIINQLFTGPEALEYLNEHFETLLPWQFNNSKEIGAQVKKFYFGDKKLAPETALQFVNMQTDLYVLYPVNLQVKLQTDFSTTPIYYYRFSFDGILGRISKGDGIPGVAHTEELDYIFYSSNDDPGLASDRPEMITLDRMVKMWTNFVKTGNPTPENDPLLQNVTWRPYTKLDHFYLDIGNDLVLHRDISNDRLGFMTDIHNEIHFPI